MSTPLEWDELEGDLTPAKWTILTEPPRFAERGDLFRPLLGEGEDLLPAIDALQEYLREG